MLIASPVAQLYINNEEFDTIFCIGNFLSFFSPKIKNLPVECRIAATNSKGIFLLKKVFELNYNGSLSLSIKKLLKEENIQSEIGLILCQIYPKTNLRLEEIFNESGKCFSHFFILYKSMTNNSISLVHPQSTIGGKPFTKSEWKSNQIISTNNLKELRIYQANHSETNKSVKYFLCEPETGSIICENSLESIEAMTAKFISFDKSKFFNYSNLYLKTNNLPVGNGKPLIMKIFEDNSFTIIHG